MEKELSELKKEIFSQIFQTISEKKKKYLQYSINQCYENTVGRTLTNKRGGDMKHLHPVRKISLWQQLSFLLFLTNRKGGALADKKRAGKQKGR